MNTSVSPLITPFILIHSSIHQYSSIPQSFHSSPYVSIHPSIYPSFPLPLLQVNILTSIHFFAHLFILQYAYITTSGSTPYSSSTWPFIQVPINSILSSCHLSIHTLLLNHHLPLSIQPPPPVSKDFNPLWPWPLTSIP